MPDLVYTNLVSTLYEQPQVGQTLTVQTQEEIEQQGYYIAKKNLKNYNEIPIEKSNVFINFVAKKIFLTDIDLSKITNTEFTYFVDEVSDVAEPFIPLINGMIFRCLGEGLQDLRSYTYYIYEDGMSKQIPNYQTLEVMLAERGVSYSTIKVLNQNECQQIQSSGVVVSRQNEWNNSLSDSTGFSTLTQLSQNISTLNQITAALGGSVAQEQANVNNQLAAQSAAMQASAAAAQAQADAAATANATAQAAQTQAQASLAAVNAAAASAQAQADAAAALVLAASNT